MKRLLAPLVVLVVFVVGALSLMAVTSPTRAGSFEVPQQLDTVIAATDRTARSHGDGDDDDDDDDDAGLAIRAAAANVEGSPPILLLAGKNFCDDPRVAAGAADGTLAELVVFNASDNFLQAGLTSTDPGTYRITVNCPAGSDSIDVTLGAAGPPGPPGEDGADGIPPGQSCPEGTVAIGFDVDGTLQCSQRTPVNGVCPCFSDAELAALRQVIEDATAEEPGNSALVCQTADDSIGIDFGVYPASGANPIEVDVFASGDLCSERTWLPDAGVVEQYVTPLAPDEAAKCSASILATAQSLGCL